MTTEATAKPKLTKERASGGRTDWVGARPITFDEFLELFDENDNVELVNGVGVQRMAAQLDHERLFAWLMTLLSLHVEDNDLGLVLGSRTAVQISAFGGRLPDLLFVRRDNLGIVQQKAIYGTPDLTVELVSPHDRRAELIARETEYRAIGVAEMWFADRKRGTVRVVTRQGDGAYAEAALGMADTLISTVVPGLRLSASWLLSEPRPSVRDALAAMLSL